MISLSLEAYALLRAFQSGCMAALVGEPFKVWVFSGAEDGYCQLWRRPAFTELAARGFVHCCSDSVWQLSDEGRKVP